VALAASPIRVELGDRHVQAREPVGVHRALHVTLQHADARPGRSRRPLEERRLAGSGRAREVHDLDARAVEVGPAGPRDRVVGVERL
jgi:hypothetical protein